MNVGYKLSQFVLMVPLDQGNSSFVLKNTLSGDVIKVTPEHKKLLESLPEVSEEDLGVWQHDENIFTDTGMTIRTEEDENNKFLERMRTRREIDVLATYLVTTLGCNLACSYCFEKDVLNSDRMQEDLYSSVLRWYQRKLELERFKRAIIVLYGGKPLADQRGLRYFVPELNNLGQELNKPVEFELITNGVLLSRDIVGFLIQHNLRQVQITLDGPPVIHDSLRCMRGGQSTFWKIVENTESLFNSHCRVVLRVNLSKRSFGYTDDLLLLLRKRNWHKYIALTFGIVEDDFRDRKRKVLGTCSGCIGSEGEIADVYISAVKEAKDLGFTTPEDFGEGPCMTSIGDAFVVGPDGSLYKCMEVVGRKEFSVGSIFDEVLSEEQLRYENPEYLTQCLEEKCTFLPLCAGGCRSGAFRETGSTFERHCRLPLLRDVNKKLIQISF